MAKVPERIVIKYLIIAFACIVVVYPLWARAVGMSWTLDRAFLSNLFPIFGILGFTLLWLHVFGAAFEPWLVKYIDFGKFINKTSMLIFVTIILHPLLLLVSVGFSLSKVFLIYGAKYIWLAIIGWLLLLTYDLGRFLKKRDFFVRNWNKILLISTIGFIFIFFHSLGLGTDLQSGPLRTVWIFYGVTAILSTIYTYGIKRYINGG